MNHAAQNACSEDIHSLKNIGLEYFTRQLPDRHVDPPIPVNSPKQATRSWTHPQIWEMLLPMCYRNDYLADPEG
jgi:hypothetical protein